MAKGLVTCGMPVNLADYKIIWEKLPNNFELPDDPADSISQPAIEQERQRAERLIAQLRSACIEPER